MLCDISWDLYLSDWLSKQLYKESKSFIVIKIILRSLVVHFNRITYDRIVINSFINPLFLMDSIIATGRLKWTKSNEQDKTFTDDGLYCLVEYQYRLISLEVNLSSKI